MQILHFSENIINFLECQLKWKREQKCSLFYVIELTNINKFMTKYECWYNDIIKNANIRTTSSKEVYTEIHHIVPKSLGGTNDQDNLVRLTAREHFICHWLLIKIHNEGEAHWKMINALRYMRAGSSKRYSNKITARVYENLKTEYANLLSERYSGTGNPMYGRPVSDEVKRGRRDRALNNNPMKIPEAVEKVRNSKIGKKRTPFHREWIKNLSDSHLGERNGMHGKNHSEHTKDMIRQKAIGRKQSEETIRKKADAIRGTKREKKICLHCDKEVAVNGYARWHGDNCKKKVRNNV